MQKLAYRGVNFIRQTRETAIRAGSQQVWMMQASLQDYEGALADAEQVSCTAGI
jgi:hypothetical protein